MGLAMSCKVTGDTKSFSTVFARVFVNTEVIVIGHQVEEFLEAVGALVDAGPVSFFVVKKTAGMAVGTIALAALVFPILGGWRNPSRLHLARL